MVELKSFSRDADAILSAAEKSALIDMIAAEPRCGKALGGGLYKVRFAYGAKGKSAGVRVVYVFMRPELPVFLIAIFAKNEKSNITAKELGGLLKLADDLTAAYEV